MNKQKKEYIVNALATYLCIQGIKTGRFIPDIETGEIMSMLYADGDIKEKAIRKAFQIIRIFEKE